MPARFALSAVLLCSIVSCSGGGGTSCAVNDDCESGFCKADGTCAPAGGDVDAGDSGGDGGGGDATTAVCTPNHDGVITADELPMAAGKMATFRIATGATWNTAGTSAPNGQRAWDLSGALLNDEDQQIALVAPTGMWWESTYPSATYASLLSTSSDLSGVFVRSASRLDLIGVVSPDGGAGKTELEYDGPAQVLAIPLQAGSSWSSSSIVTGYLNGGTGGAYTESYESNVDAVGTMKTPYGDFPVIRIATNMTRTSVGVTIASSRTFTWVAECFGPVATVSKDNPTTDELTKPTEIRRLAP